MTEDHLTREILGVYGIPPLLMGRSIRHLRDVTEHHPDCKDYTKMAVGFSNMVLQSRGGPAYRRMEETAQGLLMDADLFCMVNCTRTWLVDNSQ